MKTFIFTLSVIITLNSCASMDKMVRSGRYDDAFSYAIQKIRLGFKLKDEQLKGMEVAFDRLNEVDLRAINQLSMYNREANLMKIMEIYKKLEYRHNLVRDLSPIISKKGMVGNFKLLSYNDEIMACIHDLCEYKYNEASQLLANASRAGRKSDAIRAYQILTEIEAYNSDYKDIRRMKEKAYALGLTTVSLKIENELNGRFGRILEHKLTSTPMYQLDSKWYDFSRVFDDPMEADLTVVVRVKDLEMGREFERVNSFEEHKHIEIYEDCHIENTSSDRKKNYGAVDTSHVWMPKKTTHLIHAYITEVFRERNAIVTGVVKIVNNRNRSIISERPIKINHNFNGYGCKFEGDERAISDQTKFKLDPHLEFFPNDEEIIDNLGTLLSKTVVNESRSIGR